MKAGQVQIFLFDGERKAVQGRVNDFLRTLGQGGLEPDIVAVGFNYQGPEYDGRTMVDGSQTHGILLVAHYPTINETRAALGYEPIDQQPGATPQEVSMSLAEFLREFAQLAQQPKRGWWGRIKNLFRR